MKAFSRIYAKINLNAIEENFLQMKQNLKNDTNMIAVIKADGYGHGAVPIAQMLESCDYIWGYAVAAVEEAMELRNAGIKKPIIILGYTFEEDYEQIVQNDIQPAVFKKETAKKLSEIAKKLGKNVYIHIAVDTGMGRIGFDLSKKSTVTIKEISDYSNIKIEGLFTHFARADEESLDPAEVQLERYQLFYQELQKAGVEIRYCHVSNSAAIMQFPKANLDLVRAGISMYGLYPSDEVNREFVKLQPAMSLYSHISYIKTVEPGTPISYGGTYVTKETTKVATIPVGYADGYARGLSNKGYVLIRGQKAPILGRVCMDQFMVDVTAVQDVQELDQVTLLGADGEESITMEMLGDLSGRFNYEFACCISKRVPRIYERDGKIIE